MSAGHSGRVGAAPPVMRHHDADGVSLEACAVIRRHGLNRDHVLGWADRYGIKEGVDFNLAPRADFENAPLGSRLAEMAYRMPAFGPFHKRFYRAFSMFDYGTSDGIMDECLRGGVVEQAGKSVYGDWKRYAERLEGLNVALFRAVADAIILHRFISDLCELGNYRNGRWRRDGDDQDRVSTTVGASNFHLDKMAVAMVTYDAGALRGRTQAVCYSPYPRNSDAVLERFGCEKDGIFAAEGEVHIHAGCPIPPRRHIKIALLPRSKHGREYVNEQYGDVAIVE